MQNGFDGIVYGLYTVPDCVMLDCGAEAPCDFEDDVMIGYTGGRAFRLKRESEMQNQYVKAVCKCHVIRIFGIGLVGGGVLCRALRVLGKAGICFYGASVSECGIALALPRESLSEAVRALSLELLEGDNI